MNPRESTDAPPLPAPDMQVAWRQKVERFLAAAIEGSVLVLVCGLPWCFGLADAMARLLLACGLMLLLVLWAGRLLIQGRLVWQKCPVALCLALLFLGGILQLVSFPTSILSVLAPATARFHEQAMPRQAEVVALDVPAPVLNQRASISLDPHATRTQVMELLAVLLLFALIRNHIAPAQGLHRLSACVLANGAALALVGFALCYLTGDDTASGTLLDRKHLGLYLEMSLGLGAGALLGGLRLQVTRHDPAVQTAGRRPAARLPAILMAVGMLIISAGLAHQLAAGAIAALGGAAIICLLALLPGSARKWALTLGILVGIAAIVLFPPWSSWKAPAALWSRVGSFCAEFPLWGTGLGTFAQVASNQGFFEPQDAAASSSAAAPIMVLSVEGGAFGVALSSLAIVFIFRLAFQALRNRGNDAGAGLAFGALFSFAMLILHGCFAVAPLSPEVGVLATVLCGYLCGLARGQTPTLHGQEVDATSQYLVPFGGLTALGGALLLIVLGVILLGHAWRGHVLHCLAETAAGLDTREDHENRLRHYEQMRHLAPGDVSLRTKLARAHMQAYQEKLDSLNQHYRIMEPALIATALSQGAAFEIGSAPTSLVAWSIAIECQERAKEEEKHLERQHIGPALQHWFAARQACPLNPEPQLGLAALGRHMIQAEAPRVYRQRARQIAPRGARIFFECGRQELAAGQFEQAWIDWRLSLELSDAFLGPILEHSRHHLTVTEILGRILADRPQQLVSAADVLFPASAVTKERMALFEKALQLQQEQPHWTPADWRLAAISYSATGQIAKSRDAFDRALAAAPWQIGWRYEFALSLYQAGQYDEAHNEASLILARQPGHKRAQELSLKVRERRAN